MKRLLIGCFGLLGIILVIAVVILWYCRPEGRPLNPDEVKGYDYSATTASGAVLSATSTISFDVATTPAQRTESSNLLRNPGKLPLHNTGDRDTFLDWVTSRKYDSFSTIGFGNGLKLFLILINLTIVFGFLIWLGFYTTAPFNDNIHPILNFLGGFLIAFTSLVWHWPITTLVVLAVFYGLSRLYRMTIKQMMLACFIAIGFLMTIVGIFVFFAYFIDSLFNRGLLNH